MADNATINKQIAVLKTGKSLVELLDNIRFQENSAWPFDKGARILCKMKDYSNGTGDNAVDVTHNLAITDVKKISQQSLTKHRQDVGTISRKDKGPILGTISKNYIKIYDGNEIHQI